MIKALRKNYLLAIGAVLISASVGAQTTVPPNDSCEYAMQFMNGENEYEYIEGFGDGISKTDNFSISGWFKTNATEQSLMALTRDICCDRYGFIDVDANGKLTFKFETTFQTETINSSTNVNDDAWHHFAAVRNTATDSIYLYVDGVLEAKTSYTRDIFGSVDLRLTLGLGQSPNYFNGGMDEVSYWNKAISAAEVQSVMNSKLQGDESNLVAYYNFNEWKEYGEVRDASGNGHTLRFSDVSNFNRFLPQGVGCDLPTTLTPPNNDCGAVVNFDGINDYIATNVTGSNFLDKDFTIETWVYLDSIKESGNIILSNLTVNEGFDMSVAGASSVRGRLSFLNRFSTTTLKEKTWYHIAVTFDDSGNNRLTLYINGFEDAVYADFNDIRNPSSTRVPMGDLLLGYSADDDNSDNQNLKGKMDELRIWSEVRTQAQIFSMLDSSITDSTSNLAATFDFNDGNNATHIHSLTGKVSAEGELKNMDLGSAWSELDGSAVQNSFSEIVEEDFCGTFTSPNGNSYTEDGTYIEVLSNNAGCDSTIRMDLSFIKLTLDKEVADVEVNGDTLSAVQDPSASLGYEWYNCDKPDLGILSTERTFTPSESGDYKLHVTRDFRCPAISDCIEMTISSTSTQEQEIFEKLSLYPNPTNGLLNIDLGKSYQNVSIEVYSITGELLDTFYLGTTSDALVNINAKPGVYFVNVKEEGGLETTLKVIKK